MPGSNQELFFEILYQKGPFHVQPVTLNMCSATILHQISNAKMHLECSVVGSRHIYYMLNLTKIWSFQPVGECLQ